MPSKSQSKVASDIKLKKTTITPKKSSLKSAQKIDSQSLKKKTDSKAKKDEKCQPKSKSSISNESKSKSSAKSKKS